MRWSPAGELGWLVLQEGKLLRDLAGGAGGGGWRLCSDSQSSRLKGLHIMTEPAAGLGVNIAARESVWLHLSLRSWRDELRLLALLALLS